MLIETIKIQNGVISNPELHNERMYRSRLKVTGSDLRTDISSLPWIKKIPVTDQIIKARIVYAEQIISMEWEYYRRREIRSLKLVEDNGIDYSFKYSDRSRINHLYENRGEADDIIIVKDEMLTDSSYSNLAFFDGSKWFTPSTPLLAGTKRQQLIREGKLSEEELRPADLKRFRSVSLINALNGLGEVEVEMTRGTTTQ